MLHIDDQQRISGYRELLIRPVAPDTGLLSPTERQLCRMLVATLGDSVLDKHQSVQSAADLAWAHPHVLREVVELLDVLEGQIAHVHRTPLPRIPLQTHSRYTRIEILAAVGVGSGAKTPQWREGVYDAKEVGADLLLFTLDKTGGDFSPTTRYRDYAISPELIHWESQSGTRANSPTGLRYQNHVAQDRSILLFARHHSDDRAFWFLGPATYVRHEGERPMSITWRLLTPLPGDLYASFAAAVA